MRNGNRTSFASRTLAISLLASVLAFGAAGCAANQPVGSGSGSAPVQQEKPAKKTPAQLAAKAYRDVLDDPAAHFELDDNLSDDVSFSYSLVNMTTDDLPQLLVRATGSSDAWNGTEIVRVFSYDADADTLIAPATDITIGVAGSGGFRGGLSYSACGNGLLLSELSSGTGQGSISRLALEGDSLAKTFVAPVDLSSDSAIDSVLNNEGKDIDWIDASDLSVIETLEKGDWTSTVSSESDVASDAQAAGLSTFTGTVRILDADGLCNLQGQANPNPGVADTSNYVVLDLGSEQQMSAMSGDGSSMREGTASLLLLDRTDSGRSWDSLDGKTVTVAVDAGKCYWPSDTSLPLGAPRCTGAVAVIG